MRLACIMGLYAELETLKPFMYHSVLLTASPNPGVSTIVSFSLTPFSSMSTVCLVISTVWVILSTNKTDITTTQPSEHIQQHSQQTPARDELTFSIEQFSVFVEICKEQTVDQGGLS